MAAILDNAKTVYAAGPSSAPTEPNKADIIRLFALVEGIIGSAVNGLVVGSAVVYQTRASLFANLARPADSLGIVYGDSTAAYNGVYVKAGASGSGSWTLTNLALPATFTADLAAVIVAQAATQSEVTAARSGSASLVARLNLILDTALGQSDNVLNYLNGVIDAQATASQQRDTALGGRIDNEAATRTSADTALGVRIDDILEDQAATTSEVIAARQGSASLSDRITLKLDNSTATGRILGRKTAGTGAVEQLAPVRGLSIDATGVGLADMAEATVKGRVAGGDGHTDRHDYDAA